MVRTAAFDYELPEELIAQRPAPKREDARLLVLASEGFEHRRISELPELLPERALVVLNQTRVRHARLFGQRQATLGRVEFLLLEPLGSEGTWRALGKANRPLNPGDHVLVGDAVVEVLAKDGEGVLTLRLETSESQEALVAREGHLPLPPYIQRAADQADDERYQTVFARELGSVAAPTAGLHLSDELLQALELRGIELGFLTLHVGVGTFRPVATEELEDHVMHAEQVEVSGALAEQIERARAEKRPVVAVGTTVVRALESAARESGRVRSFSGPTRLFIKPGFQFRAVDALLTNFHMPKSTLLALVAAFAGYDLMMTGYREAIAQKYRFLSYGDAMWIPRRHAGTH